MSSTKLILGYMLAVGMLVSCNNANNTSNTVADRDFKDSIEDKVNAAIQDAQNAVSDLKVDVSHLTSANAIARETLQQVFPSSLGGITRAVLEVDDASEVNFSKIKSDYEQAGNPKSIHLKITDGAGNKGSRELSEAIREIQSGRAKTERDEYEKSATILGHNAWVKEKTAANDKEAEIKLIHADRYLIEIEGDGFSLAELTDILKEIDLSSLK